MSSDRNASRWWGEKEHSHSIQHKITATIFVLLILFSLLAGLIYVLLNKWFGLFGSAAAVVLFIILALLLAKSTAKILGFKFIDQVNNITGTARAIANSQDLSRRIETSSRPDELLHLQSALNDMLKQLEESFEMQRRFTADASHELRTPIAVMNGYLDILQKWGMNNPELLEESIVSMKDETLNMKKISENLLLLSRLELGQHINEWDDLALHEILSKLVKDTAIIAGGRSIKLTEISFIKIKGDYSLILQMLRAVVDNSLKYTAEDGEIDISLKQDQDRAVIQIKDNGIGIPQEDTDKIFYRFYRVDKGRDRAIGGTGLGLSLVKQIAELHGGSVEAESFSGQGTTIRFCLPTN